MKTGAARETARPYSESIRSSILPDAAPFAGCEGREPGRRLAYSRDLLEGAHVGIDASAPLPAGPLRRGNARFRFRAHLAAPANPAGDGQPERGGAGLGGLEVIEAGSDVVHFLLDIVHIPLISAERGLQ